MPETSQPSEQAAHQPTVIDSDWALAKKWQGCGRPRCYSAGEAEHFREQMAADIAAAREAFAVARDTPYQQGRREHRFMQERDAAIAESARWAAQFKSTNAAGVQLADKLAAAETCTTCDGHPPTSGLVCICDGTGRRTDETVNLRRAVHDAEARVAALVEAWDQSWDCSADPGHEIMNAALRLAKEENDG